MKLRKVASLTALVSFVFLALTSLILFVVPHGRVAYWSDWRLWGLSKTQWGDLHINIGVLFLVAIIFHLYFNWKPLVSYLKTQSKQMVVFTGEFTASLIILLVFCLGTFYLVPPFSWVLDGNAAIKDRAMEKYGEPPYGHAELSSLKIFAQRTSLDLDQATVQLRAAGIVFENDRQTIQNIAEHNQMKPKEVYLAMLPAESVSASGSLPLDPQPGLGKLSLAELCNKYGLEIGDALQALKAEDFQAEPEMSLRAIGQQNNVAPIDIYMTLRNSLTPDEGED